MTAGVKKCNTDKTDCKVFWRKVSRGYNDCQTSYRSRMSVLAEC